MIFDTDKIFDCKRNLSKFCNITVFSGFSVENESMLAFVIYTVQCLSSSVVYRYWIFAVWKKSFGDYVLVSVRYVFTIFYSIFRICIFVVFC